MSHLIHRYRVRLGIFRSLVLVSDWLGLLVDC
jgi:hypothetical protein